MKALVALTILALSLASVTIPCYASETNTKNGTVSRTTSIKPNRPSAPSHSYIHFIYTRGHIDFTLSPTMEYLDVTISKDDIPVWSGTVTQDEPSAEIPVLYGEYTIACITDNGQVYLGVLNF